MDAHYKVYPVVKFLVILLRGEVGQIWCQERKVAVQTRLKAQLFEQLLFGFEETGDTVQEEFLETDKRESVSSQEIEKQFSSDVKRQAGMQT